MINLNAEAIKLVLRLQAPFCNNLDFQRRAIPNFSTCYNWTLLLGFDYIKFKDNKE